MAVAVTPSMRGVNVYADQRRIDETCPCAQGRANCGKFANVDVAWLLRIFACL
jgi:hypothetical protein